MKTRKENRYRKKEAAAGRSARSMSVRIVPYDPSYDEAIGAIDASDLQQLRHDRDVFPETVRLALSGKTCCGVGFLSLGTFNDGLLTVYCSFDVNSSDPAAIAAAKGLLKALKACFEALKPRLQPDTARLTVFAREDSAAAAFVQANGFRAGRAMDAFRNDLSRFPAEAPEGEETPQGPAALKDTFPAASVAFPDGSVKEARIAALDVLDPADMDRYLRANGRGFGRPDSADGLRFRAAHWGARVYAWLCEGEVLSAVTVWPRRNGAFATEDVFCVPEFRRQGLTEKLLLFLLEKGKREGFSEAQLNAFSHREDAVRLYEKCGYVKTERLTEFYVE